MRAPRLAVLLASAVLAVLAVPASAQTQDTEPWEITRYDVAMTVQDNADLQVVEDIQLDFGSLQRRGIFRYIPVWEDLPTPLPADLEVPIPDGADPAEYFRLLKVENLEVTSASGAPTDVDIQGPKDLNGNLQIRIGDPDITVTGQQRYRISYLVRGAMEPLPDGPALAWDAVGTGWGVPIRQVSVNLQAPQIQQARCLQGPEYATDACDAAVSADNVQFQSSGALAPHEGLTVSVQLAPGAVDVPPILVDQKPSLRLALIGSRAAVPLTAAVVLLGALLLAMLAWRQGRDRLQLGGVTSHGTLDETRAGERRRGLFEPRTVPVEYRPPDGLRPGQLGLLVDERVDAVDVTASVVDLAVRGHLKIEEVQKDGWLRRADWRLVKGDASDDDLGGYERRLLDGLFDDRTSVLVSELKGTFAKDYQAVETALYADGQSRRWFADRPDRVRAKWLGLGIATVVIGVVGAFVLGTGFRLGAVGLAVVLLGLALMAIHRLMPRRTAKGSAMLTRTLGFREFIQRAETDRMDFAESENLFVEYLPYAVVFGAVEKWAQVFDDLGVDVGAAVGGFYAGPGPFYLLAFSSGLNDFSSSVGSAVITSPPSSSGGGFSGGGFGGGGGFSGGGMGGGGGGSW